MFASCPSPDILRQVSSGLPGDVTNTLLDDHINSCLVCQEALERLIRDPSEPAGTRADRIPVPERIPEIPDLVMERELGRGGMGVVYQAWDPRLLRHVAVKIVQSGPMAGLKERKRWLHEARSLTRVRDPHVVHLLHVGEAGGWLYLVLEFVKGESLASRIEGVLAARDAAELLLPLVSAVKAIHEAGLLHLDLKPSNILLDSAPGAPWKDAYPKVADFGIARPLAESDLTATTLAGPCGSPPYMAPEQARADTEAIGPATDIYALGAILYEMLIGRPPFQGGSPLETLEQVRTLEPVPPRRLNPGVPRDLETIVLKCLEKSPDQRYPSAAALAADLELWRDGRPIKARPASSLERAWRWCRRRPLVAALTATLALSLSVGFLSVALLWRRAEAERRRAEADARTTEEVLSQIVDQTLPGANHLQVVNPDSLIPALQQTRRRLIQVAARRPDHPVLSRQLGLVDRALGSAVSREKRWDEARSSFDEALRCFERVIRLRPFDQEARTGQIVALLDRARLFEKMKTPHESIADLRRAVGAAEELVRLQPGENPICLLAEIRHGLAGMLARRGDREQARSLMDANRRMLESVPAPAQSAAVAAYRVLAQLEFDRFRRGSLPLATLVSASDRSTHPSPLMRLASPDVDRLPAQEWAELVAQALRAAAPPDIGLVSEPDLAYMLVIPVGSMAAEQRRYGKLDEARRTADRMLALGQLLISRHPDRLTAHLALSEAYTHIYKNAWQTDDRASVDRNMRLALAAALQAQILDPNSELVRNKVDGLQRRLKDLVAPERDDSK